MKTVAFMGPQSSGKSTLMREMKRLYAGPFTEFVDEITRKVKDEYNLNINEEGGVTTQYLIMAGHLQNALKRTDQYSLKLKVLNRCSVDGLLYCKWFEKQAEDTPHEADWVRCHRHCLNIHNLIKSKYDVIFYTDPAGIEIEDDGIRSTNVEFREGVTKLFEKFISDASPAMYDRIVRLKGTVEERMKIIRDKLFELDESIVLNPVSSPIQ